MAKLKSQPLAPNPLAPQPLVDLPLDTGPRIEYVGEGAEKIEFAVNPKATRYVVKSNGMVLEYL